MGIEGYGGTTLDCRGVNVMGTTHGITAKRGATMLACGTTDWATDSRLDISSPRRGRRLVGRESVPGQDHSNGRYRATIG
jgi:hypothetical protein